MSRARTLSLTAVAMLAFAANSILCRAALARAGIDPASFTIARIVSGAVTLWLIAIVSRGGQIGGSWPGALALFIYAAAFSFAYVSLPAGVGALLLFGAVQATMIVVGILHGERPTPLQWAGLVLALAGLASLVAPGVSAPPFLGSALMLAAGAAWGAYSILGRRSASPLLATAGNFLRAVPMALLLAIPALSATGRPIAGIVYAVLSGALASGVGYAIWYAALPGLSSAEGASVQLSVPVIAGIAGAAFLSEPVTLRLGLASVAVLGGIAIVILSRSRRAQ